MSNAAHISGQNAPFTLPHSPALRGCNPCVVADAFTSSLHVGAAGRFCALDASVSSHEKTLDDAIHEVLVSVVSPLLVRSHASGLFRRPAAHRRSAFQTPLPKQVWAPAPESAARHLGAGPLAQASPMGDPANPGIQP